MMEHTPIKFRILEYIEEHPGSWTDQIVPELQEEYGMNDEHGRDMINYDVIELVSAGLIHEGDSRIDEDGHYKQGTLLTCYSPTHLGSEYLADLRTKVTPKEA
ncbi:MAG: hypothetical protein Q4Q58_02400 [Thermoplasmata archaeon]|nr:hypothetical protein [Thermoplasmata archaeon]